MFQSNSPQLWVDAAESVRGWLESDRDWYYFAEGSTHHGEGEGEEEESDDAADDPIDPQDRLPIPRDDDDDDDDDEHDRHGGRRSAGGGTSSSARAAER